jgi:hypothetical protein
VFCNSTVICQLAPTPPGTGGRHRGVRFGRVAKVRIPADFAFERIIDDGLIVDRLRPGLVTGRKRLDRLSLSKRYNENRP